MAQRCGSIDQGTLPILMGACHNITKQDVDGALREKYRVDGDGSSIVQGLILVRASGNVDAGMVPIHRCRQ